MKILAVCGFFTLVLATTTAVGDLRVVADATLQAAAPAESLSSPRTVYNLDANWLFRRDSMTNASCPTNAFPVDLDGLQCTGLTQQLYAHDAESCRASCCNNPVECSVWQWCDGDSCGSGGGGGCWTGAPELATACTNSSAGGAWTGEGRDGAPPSPAPPATSCNVTATPECAADYDDSEFTPVRVPHDFIVLGDPDPLGGDMAHGFLPLGSSWYRKHFNLPAGATGESVARSVLNFEGVMVRCDVYLNGVYVGSHASGYTPFSFDVTALLQPTGNVLALFVDATFPDGWWYDGGGIYRHVTLTTFAHELRIAKHGVYAPAVVQGPISHHPDDKRPATADALLRASVEIVNGQEEGIAVAAAGAVATTVNGMMVSVIFRVSEKATGRVVVTATSDPVPAPAGGDAGASVTVAQNLSMAAASLWSTAHPFLYELSTTVVAIAPANSNNKEAVVQTNLRTRKGASSDSSDSSGVGFGARVVVDELTTTFGARKLSWEADSGFHLNDRPVKILGCANHQDFAALGVAVPDQLQAHRLERSTAALGGNAWRTAHNPPNVALLDAADAQGVLVWDENHRNGAEGSGVLAEASTLVKRDRNHPSVVLWGLCNEVLCIDSDSGDSAASDPTSVADAAALKRDAFQALDPFGQRAVSANQNDWIVPGSVLDVLGYDYATGSYDAFHALTPELPAISSETSSAVSDRGEYANDEAAGHVTGYDTEAPSWGQTAEQAWGGIGEVGGQGILTRDFVAGGFVWTGMDYRGEPTPYSWPDTNSHFGIMDLAGFDKDRTWWYRAWWPTANTDLTNELTNEAPVSLYIFPHWNWDSAGNDGSATEETDTQRQLRPLAPCVGMCRRITSSSSSSSSSSTSKAPSSTVVEVWAFTNAPSVELLLNGVSLGRQDAPRYGHVSWQVPYAPGTLEARAFSQTQSPATSTGNNDHNQQEDRGGGVVVATQSVSTVGAAASLRLSIKDGVGGGGVCAAHGLGGSPGVALVAVEVVDAAGNVVPVDGSLDVGGGDAAVTVAVSELGSFLGSSNGDPADTTNAKSPTRSAYHGKLLAIVQADPPSSDRLPGSWGGMMVVTATSPGLEPGSIEIPILPDCDEGNSKKRRAL